MDKLLKPSEAAEMLSVSRQLIYKWIQDGVIPAFRIGGKSIRVKEKDLENLIVGVNTEGDTDEQPTGF